MSDVIGVFLASTTTILIGFWMGWHFRAINDKIDQLATEITDKLVPEPEPESEPVEKPTVTMVDGDDPILMAKYETDEMHRKLNPHLYPNDKTK